MAKLTSAELDKVLRENPGWHLQGEMLVRDLVFKSFTQAMAFVDRVAVIAEQQGHHPDILIRYNKVQLKLTSYDAKTLTNRDAAMIVRLREEC